MLELGLDGGATSFVSGETIRGTARWSLDGTEEWVEIRLFWYTEGKGTQDVDTVETLRIDAPDVSGSTAFTFTAPSAPYSFSGHLISLIWAIEVVTSSGSSERVELRISPDGDEITLERLEDAS